MENYQRIRPWGTKSVVPSVISSSSAKSSGKLHPTLCQPERQGVDSLYKFLEGYIMLVH